MPFKWKNPDAVQKQTDDLDDLLASIQNQAAPPPKPPSNQLTMTLTMGGQIMSELEAPPDLDFLVQASHALTALIISGQKDDVAKMLDTLAEVTEPQEFVEVLLRAVAVQSDFMDHMLSGGIIAAKLAGAKNVDRPHFEIGNFPPPNRPKLRNLEDYAPDTQEENESHDPNPEHGDAPRPEPVPDGEHAPGAGQPADAGEAAGETDVHE